MTQLSVNINKIALLRNSRDTDHPNLLAMAQRCVAAGAQGITVHPRPDERHIRYQDVRDLSPWLATLDNVEFNIEGNPTEEFLKLVLAAQPEQCTLVPDDPQQLTSDHGWDLQKDGALLTPIITELKEQGIRVSVFMDYNSPDIALAKTIGADRIELYTEPYAQAFGTAEQDGLLAGFRQASDQALAAGLQLNAGHDLNQKNLGPLLKSIPEIAEVSIGHALIVDCFNEGLEQTIERYLQICSAS